MARSRSPVRFSRAECRRLRPIWRGTDKVAAGSFHDTDTARYTAEDFCFPTRNHALYAIGLAWPVNGEALIRSLAGTTGSQSVQSVSLLAAMQNQHSSSVPMDCTWCCPRSHRPSMHTCSVNVLRANCAVGIVRRRIREIRQFFTLLHDGRLVDCLQSPLPAKQANGARGSPYD